MMEIGGRLGLTAPGFEVAGACLASLSSDCGGRNGTISRRMLSISCGLRRLPESTSETLPLKDSSLFVRLRWLFTTMSTAHIASRKRISIPVRERRKLRNLRGFICLPP
jgi:hypothetical protein